MRKETRLYKKTMTGAMIGMLFLFGGIVGSCNGKKPKPCAIVCIVIGATLLSVSGLFYFTMTSQERVANMRYDMWHDETGQTRYQQMKGAFRGAK